MKLGFIGFGNIAQALADGLLRSGALLPQQIGATARDGDKLRLQAGARGIQPFDEALQTVRFADVVIVAVKPYQVEAVIEPLRDELRDKIVISVAAGWNYDRYEEILTPGTHHLSTIPNTPIAACEGVVVCERRHSLTDEQWRAVEELLSHVGLVQVVDTSLLAISGTICGCSPAFVALFIEALSDAAVKHGIPRADSYRMVSQMVVGTGKLQLATGAHPGAMKDAVCSPGGTTIVGVTELERTGMRGAVIAAIDAIQKRE